MNNVWRRDNDSNFQQPVDVNGRLKTEHLPKESSEATTLLSNKWYTTTSEFRRKTPESSCPQKSVPAESRQLYPSRLSSCGLRCDAWVILHMLNCSIGCVSASPPMITSRENCKNATLFNLSKLQKCHSPHKFVWSQILVDFPILHQHHSINHHSNGVIQQPIASSIQSQKENFAEFKFIEKSAKNLKNSNLDDGIFVILKDQHGIFAIFPNINYSTPDSASLFHHTQILLLSSIDTTSNMPSTSKKYPKYPKKLESQSSTLFKYPQARRRYFYQHCAWVEVQWFWRYCWRHDPVCAPWCTNDVDSELQYPFRHVSHRHFH